MPKLCCVDRILRTETGTHWTHAWACLPSFSKVCSFCSLYLPRQVQAGKHEQAGAAGSELELESR